MSAPDNGKFNSPFRLTRWLGGLAIFSVGAGIMLFARNILARLRNTSPTNELVSNEPIELSNPLIIEPPSPVAVAMTQAIEAIPRSTALVIEATTDPDSSGTTVSDSNIEDRQVDDTEEPLIIRLQFSPLIALGMMLALAAIAIFGSFAVQSSGTDSNLPFPLEGYLLPAAGIALLILVLPTIKFVPFASSAQSLISSHSMLLLNLLLRYALAIVFTFLAWTSYWNEPETIVSFTLPNIIWWLLAIIMWVVAFTRYSWNDMRNWMKRLRSQRLRLQVLHLVMLGIVLVGGFLIFRDLTGYPPDMDSDHFEDINEIWHITELGQRPVYMYRAYGREPGHFYLAAFIHDLTGQPLDFTLLKLTTGLEGLTIIIASFWVGRALFYEEDRRFGILIGVVMAAFVATSWWTLLLSRNGLRAVSMVTIIAITFVYTARAIRYNRRIDYVVAGLATGASLLTYQSTRLVPFMVGIGWLIGMAYQVRSIKQLRSWVFNFIALGITAAIVALPILYFAQQAPDMYFARSFARLVGDGQNAFGENSGNILANFLQLLPNLTENISKVLLAMNWRGDVTWAYGVFDGSPVLDPITGGLFVLGLGIVLARIFTRRDPFDLFLPIALFVMLMPSALSLANLIEVPSGSRMAGALPMVFIIIALCVVTIWQYAATATTDRKARIVIAVIFAGLWVWSATINFNTYFVKVFKGQRENTQTYHHAGEIFREFVSRTDAPGNVFMLWSQFWWDGRLLRIEAGEWDWDTFIENDDILNKTIAEMQRFEGTRYAFKPDSPVLVFFDQANTDAPELLKELFPGGDFTIVETPYTDRRFVVYEAPAQGCTWYKDYSPDWIPAACS